MKLPLDLLSTKDLLLTLIPYCKYGLLCEGIIECFRTSLCNNDSNKTPHTVIDFIMELMKLRSVLEEALNAEDENTASLVYGLYSSIIENHSRLLLDVALKDQGEKRAAVLQLVGLLVQCSELLGNTLRKKCCQISPFQCGILSRMI